MGRRILLARLVALAATLTLLISLLPARAALADGEFGDTSFLRTWERADRPVLEARVPRSWTWGPGPFAQQSEPYANSPGGSRQVQYLDKSRMELNNPRGDARSPWLVTNGLLTKELMSGAVQVGDSSFVQRTPSSHPVAGDPDDANGPTYASLRRVASLTPGENAAPNRVGQRVTATLSRNGTVGNDPSKAGVPGTEIVHFDGTFGHNIPRAFWDFFQMQCLVHVDGAAVNATVFDWVFVMGLPIGEPHWIRAKVAGRVVDVMMQPYERRIVTYTPSNPSPWQVEMGNIGRHYFAWRYGVSENSLSTRVPSFGSSQFMLTGRRGTNLVALTFDGAGANDTAAAILSVLRTKGVKSTMFLGGRWTEVNAQLANQVVRDGHELANHTQTHPDLTTGSSTAIVGEVMQAERSIINVTGRHPWLLFRLPFGAGSGDARVPGAVGSTGYHQTIGWDIDTIDWREDSTATLINQRVFSRVQGGSIILMHLGGRHTAEALPSMIDGLRARGFELVTVSEMLAR